MSKEGELVNSFKDELLVRGWRVLIARPNQTSLYFATPYGRKAPDIIALKNDELLVLEAKYSAAGLFRCAAGQSDCEAMLYLLGNQEPQEEFLAKVAARFRLPNRILLRAGLLCSNGFTEVQIEAARGLLCLKFTDDGKCSVCSGVEFREWFDGE